MLPTIVALATPAGKGALHVIRISGNDSFRIINNIALNPVKKTKDRLQVTFLKSSRGNLIDQVVISKYYAPNSYTGEDCIEISCHGNGLISKLIMDELIKFGAIYAQKGEFTKRAFLNGKIDLNQAINIGRLFESKTETEVYASVKEIKGDNFEIIKGYLNEIFLLIGECELNIDYPREIEKEDLFFIKKIRKRIKFLLENMEEFLDKSRKIKLSNYRIVLIGKPNAGKSSLANYLIGKDRIIVSNKAGTTQDAIELDFYFEGYLLTLIDTAGIDSEYDFQKYEAALKSLKELKDSDLIIHLISLEEGLPNDKFLVEYIKNKPCIRIFTKADLLKNPPLNSISVKNNDVMFLFQKLKEHLSKNYSLVGIKSKNHINHLNNACESLKKSLDENLSLDLLADYLHESYDFLNLIMGTEPNIHEKINMIFDGFCVGK